MLRVTLKGILSNKFRVLSTGLSVILGIAFLTGTLVLGDTITKTFDDLFATVYEDTDAVVRSSESVDAEFGPEIRRRIDASLVEEVRAVEGVELAVGYTQGYTQIVGSDGEAVGDPDRGAPTFGANWFDEALNPFTLVDYEGQSSRPPQGPDEVVISRSTADDGNLLIGDTTRALTDAGSFEVTIVGVATFGDAGSPGGATFVFFDTPTAQERVGQPDRFDEVDVIAAEGFTPEQVQANLRAALDGEIEVLTGAEAIEEIQSDIQQAIGFFTTFLLVFAAIGIIVGSFIIYNTFGIIVTQRVRETALLRALGATRRQVVWSIVIEAMVIGLVASLIGFGLGVLLSIGLQGLLNAFGFELPSGGTVILPRTLITAMVIGTVVTMLSAVVPALRSGRVSPIAAFRDVAVDVSGSSRARMITGGLLTTLGAALVLRTLFGSGGLSALAFGVLLTFVGVAALGPIFARPVAAVVGWPLSRLGGIIGTLARENTTRNTKRAATTAAALMVGLALITTVSIFAASISSTVDEIVDDQFAGDLVLSAGNFGGGGVSPALTEELNSDAHSSLIAAASGVRFSSLEIDGENEFVVSGDVPELTEIVDVGVVSGDIGSLSPTSVALFDNYAEDNGYAVGDEVTLRFAETGEHVFTVDVIYDQNQFAGNIFISREAFDANFADLLDFQVYVVKADGASNDDFVARVTELAAIYPNLDIQDLEEFKEASKAGINQLLGLIYTLLGLAVVIALTGIANTLSLSIYERTREIGLLRAVGMTRAQSRWMIRLEALIVATLGSVLGLLIGIFFGWGLVKALEDDGINVLTFPIPTLVIITVITGIAGIVAAWRPARRAAKLDVLDAISH